VWHNGAERGIVGFAGNFMSMFIGVTQMFHQMWQHCASGLPVEEL
jgi:hypothetical protein